MEDGSHPGDLNAMKSNYKYKLLTSRVIGGGEIVDVSLRVETPSLDLIGESEVWYKWTFYNDDDTCREVPSSCLVSFLQDS